MALSESSQSPKSPSFTFNLNETDEFETSINTFNSNNKNNLVSFGTTANFNSKNLKKQKRSIIFWDQEGSSSSAKSTENDSSTVSAYFKSNTSFNTSLRRNSDTILTNSLSSSSFLRLPFQTQKNKNSTKTNGTNEKNQNAKTEEKKKKGCCSCF